MSMSASEPDKLVKPAVTAKVAIKPIKQGPLLSSPLDAVPMKETEYDFPSVLLDRAQVARSERRAEQPKYNDDLAKVVARADIKEAMDRSDADDRLDKTKINALDGAIDFDAATFATNAAGKVSLADGAVKKSMIDPAALGSDDAVTIPKAEDPGKNALDSDIFETQEVNGDVGVTLKKGAITNEYVGKGAINKDNIASVSPGSITLPTISGSPYVENEVLELVSSTDSSYRNTPGVHIGGEYAYGPNNAKGNLFGIGSARQGLYLSAIKRAGTVQRRNDRAKVSFIDKSVLPYTNLVNKFTYDAPNENVESVDERFNLVDFGILQVILVRAKVTFTAAGTAFVTISKDKAWKADGSGYQGVTYEDVQTFQPFLIAESPANPTTVTSVLAHDSDGYRMQLQASAAGTYTLTFILGNIADEFFDTPFTW